MGFKYRIQDQKEYYFVTFTVVNWIDVFIRDTYRQVFLDSVRFCQREKGLRVGAWVIMTSHVHMILGTNGDNDLEDIIRDMKSFTSRHIRLELMQSTYESRKEWMLWHFGRAGKANSNNNDFQFWIQNNHPIQLSSSEMLLQRLNFIYITTLLRLVLYASRRIGNIAARMTTPVVRRDCLIWLCWCK